MRKILHTFSALFITATLIVSCGPKNSPKDVANEWLTAFYHMDYEAAKKVSTEDTKALLTQLGALSGMMPDSSKAQMKKASITIKDVKEEGDNATVTYTVNDMGKETPKDFPPLKLVKQSGKWLVQFSKNDQMGGSGSSGGSTSSADTTSATPPPTGDAGAPDTTHH
jgi:hypothetical protein